MTWYTNFDYFLGIFTALVWFKLILMLRLTKTFGPMITIVTSMLNNLGIFMVLWSLLLCTLACFGILVFGEIDAYSNFSKTLVLLFETSMGNWSLAMYNGLSVSDETGEVFHLCVIIINMILMLNLVIAILSETYNRLARLKLGLYYDGLIATIPSMKYDKHFGCLVLLPPPLNLIYAPLVLVFVVIRHKGALRCLNRFFVYLAFLPQALVYLFIFCLCNFLLIIPAYIYACVHKMKSRYSKAFLRQTSEVEQKKA